MELELAIEMLTLLLASRWSLQSDFITYLKVCLHTTRNSPKPLNLFSVHILETEGTTVNRRSLWC